MDRNVLNITSKGGLASQLEKLDAVAQADLVRKREITARELVQAAIDRIEAGDGVINAVVHRQFEQALAEADVMTPAPDRPLAGVPFLLKDNGPAQAGVPQTKGNAALKRINYAPEADAPLGRRFRDIGLITMGVTNMPEYGLQGDTQPRAFGATHNPWCLDRSVDGSSGGAAAAVAAGFVPMAAAGDGGGSIRGPAAACGVFGLKPSRGRMPKPVGAITDIWSTPLVISRTVRDTAAVLDAVNGALPGDLYALPRPDTPYLATLTPPKRPQRVGLLTEGPAGLAVDPECVRAVEEAGALLQDAGHQVERAYPSALLEPIPDWADRGWRDDQVISVIDDLGKLLGRPVTENDVEPYLWHKYQESRPVSAAKVHAGLGWHLSRAARLLQWWEQGFDLLVTPVVHEPQWRLEDLAVMTPSQLWEINFRSETFCMPFNASGQPAMAVPIRWTKDGRPVGVQIAAARGEERRLLQVATQLEEAVGWPSRTPPVTAPQTF
ncbi:amidase [Mesorhizobium sp. M0643]|uniref:amidase n=1 Tax=Mesorhizobium sp. M0643 TaxID=2956978 RepID=UPI0033381791